MQVPLLLLDAQADMFGPEFPVYDAAGILDRLANLLNRARLSGIPVVYVQHDGGPGAIDEQGEIFARINSEPGNIARIIPLDEISVVF